MINCKGTLQSSLPKIACPQEKSSLPKIVCPQARSSLPKIVCPKETPHEGVVIYSLLLRLSFWSPIKNLFIECVIGVIQPHFIDEYSMHHFLHNY
jgi:hypothetical protein